MEFIQIGKITGTHGLEGNVTLFHHLGKLAGLKQLKHLFIEMKRESYIPFFIEQARVDNDQELFLKLEDVDEVEQAKEISGKQVFLSSDQYLKLKPKDEDINFVGFKAWDKEAGELGLITTIFETPGQLLATIDHKGKEIIAPLNDQTIVAIDIATKTLKLNLPEGLIAVYLED